MKVLNVTVHQHWSKNSWWWWCNQTTNEKQCKVQWHNSEHRAVDLWNGTFLDC